MLSTTHLQDAQFSAESNVGQSEPKEILSKLPEVRYLFKTPKTQSLSKCFFKNDWLQEKNQKQTKTKK